MKLSTWKNTIDPKKSYKDFGNCWVMRDIFLSPIPSK